MVEIADEKSPVGDKDQGVSTLKSMVSFGKGQSLFLTKMNCLLIDRINPEGPQAFDLTPTSLADVCLLKL